ncbi:MAG TPA: hypothetical protein VJT08_05715 [Terriglobales bacterium]|nr:hypothetical protein [Terriglobales bacterium]
MSARFLFRTMWLVLGVLQIAAVVCAFERPAHAYVDPGSGYMLLQVIGSMCAGAIFYLRHRLRRLFAFGAQSSSEAETSVDK